MTRRTALQTLSAAALSAWPANAAVSHRLIAQDNGVTAIIDAQGQVEWMWENGAISHDLHLLPNGNVMVLTGRATIAEVNPRKEVVWQWESKPAAPYEGRVEIHGFQRLPNGRTMIAETGNRRIIEIDASRQVVSEVKLQIEKPHPHRDTRLVRKTPAGTYLVPQEGDGLVREYDGRGEIVWEYRMELTGPETPTHQGHGYNVYSAYRLPGGNTLIGGGNNNRVLEVNPKGEIVWSIGREELPGIKLFWITQLHALPNGNVVLTNTHAGPDYPQIIEVNRNKEILWTFSNWDPLGNGLCANQLLDAGEGVIR